MASPECRIALYLTARFGKKLGPEEKPLTPTEWSKLTAYFRENNIPLEELLGEDIDKLLADFSDKNITPDRITRLLSRSVSMNLKIGEWSRTGFWIYSRSDPYYPNLLNQRLGNRAPPVLFGSGDVSLLNHRGIAIVGSRNANEDDLRFTAELARDLGNLGYSIISGCARGVDQSAMLSALENGGTSVGVLPNDLLRSATSSRFREHLMSKSLVLVSAYHPEAGFSRGSAMSRNEQIYCLAQSAVVAAYEENRGGSWHGAVTNLKAKWKIPLWVPMTGKAALVDKGAMWLSDNAAKSIDNFLQENAGLEKPSSELPESELSQNKATSNLEAGTGMEQSSSKDGREIYELFLKLTCRYLSTGPKRIDDITQNFKSGDISKNQIQKWLQRAAEEEHLERIGRPIRYSLPDSGQPEQLTLPLESAD